MNAAPNRKELRWLSSKLAKDVKESACLMKMKISKQHHTLKCMQKQI